MKTYKNSTVRNKRNRPWPSNKSTTSYRLEPFESRVLLSADLAAAAQTVAQRPIETPPMAVVHLLESSPALGESAARGQGEGAVQGRGGPPGFVETLVSTVRDTGPPIHIPNGPPVQETPPPPDTPLPPAGTQFSRMFPSLAPFSADTPAVRDALLEIGKTGGLMDPLDDLSDPVTLITDPAKSVRNPDNPAMTAGMTFLGQFLDHDITLDRRSTLEQPSDPSAVQNLRTAAFDLDSVYGGGPAVSPHLYDFSPGGRGIKLRVEEIPGSPDMSRGGFMRYDLPRDEQNQALLGDSRNDENLIIAQLHAAFLKFHNAVVDHVIETSGLSDPAAIFAEAQRSVQWHYQWIIVNEFLPKTIGPELANSILREGNRFYAWQDHPLIPVEFSVAAYRFGHSQVRPSYRANFGPAPGQEFFALTFNDSLSESLDHADLRGGERAPRRFVDWQTFFDFGDGNVRPNKQIDTRLSSILFDLPATPGTEPQSLAQRNLLRHLTFGLPSGQSVALAMGIDPLRPSAFRDLAPYGLHVSTPLWFYVLREAEVVMGGTQLGPVGGRIVGEVFAGLLKGDPTTYLSQNPEWKPTLTGTGTFTMVDLLKTAGVVATL